MEQTKSNFFEGFKEGAIAFLGVIVQIGKEKSLRMFGDWQASRIDSHGFFRAAQSVASKNLVLRSRFEAAIKDAENVISCEELLGDPVFLLSLRLGILNAIARRKTGEKAFDLFRLNLQNIFTPVRADRISVKAIELIEAEFKQHGTAGNFFPKNEEINMMLAPWESILQRVAQGLGKENTDAIIAYTKRLSGNSTLLVPCPECKLQKRVTTSGPARTKNFRCTCGFDKPYPFTTVAS